MISLPKELKPVFQSQLFLRILLIGLFSLGLGIRILDLTDAPLDFHPWRQLRAASIARAKYYAMLPSADPEIRNTAISLGKRFEILEPRIFESLVAYTYRIVGGEYLWIARLYAILFWMVGGIALYLLARRLASTAGALLSLTFYLILPFGVTGSRAFLPEPLMIMWILLAVYALDRWSEERSWRWAAFTGIASGLAILVKVFAFFPLVISFGAVVLSSWGIKRAVKDPQVWIVGFLSGLLPASYYFFAIPRSASTYVSGWVYGFSHLLTQPGFYVRWMTVLDGLVNLPVLFLSLLSVGFFSSKGRLLSLGLWIGYGLLGMSVPSLIQSHTYYNLPLIPILALSLAPLGELVFTQIGKQTKVWQIFFSLVAAVAITYPMILSRNAHVARDYRLEAAAWEKLGKVMPKEGDMIGLTHDYDTRLIYYGWTAVAHWPYVSDLEMLELAGMDQDLNDPAWRKEFEKKTQGYKYFVITLTGELDAQPVLKSILYENYEIYAEAEEGEYYIIFDLHNKK